MFHGLEDVQTISEQGTGHHEPLSVQPTHTTGFTVPGVPNPIPPPADPILNHPPSPPPSEAAGEGNLEEEA